MEWLWYVLLIGGCTAIVVGVIAAQVIRRKKGKAGCYCGCDCAHCTGCARSAKEESDAKKIV